ncbi:hypothetical protein PLESTM_000992200 [Pleodorina starrii]|nr:hypothetical protein PLESTM_000992200 [Pleodorina starrii]
MAEPVPGRRTAVRHALWSLSYWAYPCHQRDRKPAPSPLTLFQPQPAAGVAAGVALPRQPSKQAAPTLAPWKEQTGADRRSRPPRRPAGRQAGQTDRHHTHSRLQSAFRTQPAKHRTGSSSQATPTPASGWPGARWCQVRRPRRRRSGRCTVTRFTGLHTAQQQLLLPLLMPPLSPMPLPMPLSPMPLLLLLLQ